MALLACFDTEGILLGFLYHVTEQNIKRDNKQCLLMN